LSNITFSDIPLDPVEFDAFVDVIETSVESSLDELEGTSNVTVTSVGGLSTGNRRSLQQTDDGVEVDIDVSAVQECFNSLSVCDDLAKQVFALYSGALLTSVENGALTTEIQQQAVTSTVPVLRSASVNPDSYVVVSNKTFVVEDLGNTTTGGDPDDPGTITTSAASSLVLYTTTWLGATFCMLLLVL
jgi:hypothetical protein